MIFETSSHGTLIHNHLKGVYINFKPLGNKALLLEYATVDCSTLVRLVELAQALL
jgi:hypothetical protein